MFLCIRQHINYCLWHTVGNPNISPKNNNYKKEKNKLQGLGKSQTKPFLTKTNYWVNHKASLFLQKQTQCMYLMNRSQKKKHYTWYESY